jgi:hypothetical protein
VPEPNEIKHGYEIGKHSKYIYQWLICDKCNNGRWVIKGMKPKFCRQCPPSIRFAASFKHYSFMDNEPLINEIRHAQQIGKNGANKYKWIPCDMCGKPRWAKLVYGKPVDTLCSGCGRRKYKWNNKGSLEQPCCGDKCKGIDIGQRDVTFIYNVCDTCGKGRWSEMINGKPISTTCLNCVSIKYKGNMATGWKGGRNRIKQGYIHLWISKDDFFSPMRNSGGNVLEHRLVVAKNLGRCLWDWEVIHHKNGIKDDNRIENLELTTNSAHLTDHHKGYKDGYAKGLIDGRSKQIEELKQEIRLLQLQINGRMIPT